MVLLHLRTVTDINPTQAIQCTVIMTGYGKLAAFMAEKCQSMFRRYDQLAVRDLLYLQAELRYLEIEYSSIAKNDATEEDERQYYDRDWWHLQSSESRGFRGLQWEKAKQIRAKLREYCKFNCDVFVIILASRSKLIFYRYFYSTI